MLGLGFCAGAALGITGDGAVVMTYASRDREGGVVPRGVGRVGHDDAHEAVNLVIPIVRNGVEEGCKDFPQTGDVSISRLADDGLKNLKLSSKERNQFIQFHIGCSVLQR